MSTARQVLVYATLIGMVIAYGIAVYHGIKAAKNTRPGVRWARIRAHFGDSARELYPEAGRRHRDSVLTFSMVGHILAVLLYGFVASS